MNKVSLSKGELDRASPVLVWGAEAVLDREGLQTGRWDGKLLAVITARRG
ncbi:MAG: hypothetical protein ABSG59_00840 [Verrucomicrobiota bacterium]|jgi:hypothetical protein